MCDIIMCALVLDTSIYAYTEYNNVIMFILNVHAHVHTHSSLCWNVRNAVAVQLPVHILDIRIIGFICGPLN